MKFLPFLPILPNQRAQTKASEGPLWKEAIKVELEVLDMPHFAHIAQKINRFEAFGWTVVDVVLFEITGFPFS